MPRMLIWSALALSVPLAASAEPVVVRWPEGQYQAWVSDSTDRIAPIRLAWIDDMQSGHYTVIPRLSADGWFPVDCQPAPFVFEQLTTGGYDGTPIGSTIAPGMTGWANAFYCFVFESTWPIALEGHDSSSCGADGCPLFGVGLTPAMADGLNIFPIRVQVDEGANWYYGWIAVRAEQRFLEDCELCVPNPPVDMEYSDVRYVGLALETEPNTPIVNGGGLCEADLNFDTLLDLDDVQAFAQGFIAGDPAVDFNGDGVFDLADVQRFITGFTTGCTL